MLRTSLRAACVALFLVSGAAAAAAADALRIATLLTTATVATGDMRITYEKVSAKGDDVVLTNVKLTLGGDNTATFPSLVISGAVERQNGGFSAMRMAFDGGSAKAPRAPPPGRPPRSKT